MRPDNWENPYNYQRCVEVCKVCDTEDVCKEAYGAGADAMLEGLKDDGVFTYGNHTPDIDDAPEVSGYWVFIPEGE